LGRLTHPNDSSYQAVAAFDDFLADATIFTTEEVFTEFLTFFAEDAWLRSRAAETVRTLFSDPAVRIIPQSHQSFLAGLDLYSARPDKGYSLTDCISMATMRREGLSEALTNDRHFEQEGFRALFRDSR
jgi:predicted nucleic acid-binding protein